MADEKLTPKIFPDGSNRQESIADGFATGKVNFPVSSFLTAYP